MKSGSNRLFVSTQPRGGRVEEAIIDSDMFLRDEAHWDSALFVWRRSLYTKMILKIHILLLYSQTTSEELICNIWKEMKPN